MIAEMYLKKVVNDQLDDSQSHPRSSLSQHVLNCFVEKYGLLNLAKTHVIEFVTSLRKCLNEHPRVKLFADLCGANGEPVPSHYADFCIDTLSTIMKVSSRKTLAVEKTSAEVLLLQFCPTFDHAKGKLALTLIFSPNT